MTLPVDQPWFRGGLLLVALGVLLAPVFGLAAGAVGYAEPLENAAEETGATDDAVTINSGLLPDYSVPGLGTPLGTLLSAVVGTALVLAVGIGAGRLLER